MGNFRVVQIFVFFEGRTVNAKIKTGRNSHRYFTCKACGGCGFLAKFFTLENSPLYCIIIVCVPLIYADN